MGHPGAARLRTQVQIESYVPGNARGDGTSRPKPPRGEEHLLKRRCSNAGTGERDVNAAAAAPPRIGLWFILDAPTPGQTLDFD
jgi:hypothetical protein